jgi:flagellar biosynthesis protein FlhG
VTDRRADRHGRSFLHRWLRRSAEVEAPRRRQGAVIAFASGKGGTGKSFLATNAALALHQRGHRTVLVDCDFGLANAHLLMGITPRYSLHHLLEGAASLPEVMTRTPYGPMLVAGGSGVAGLAEMGARQMQTLARALDWLSGCHDVVLLDCGAGLAPQSLITVLSADLVVIVTNPEIAALTDAYALIKCIARQRERPSIHLVVNRVAQAGLGQATFARLGEVSRRFAACEIHYLGEVPEDPAVMHHRLGQPPLLHGSPACATSLALTNLCADLERQMVATVAAVGVEARMAAQIRRW